MAETATFYLFLIGLLMLMAVKMFILVVRTSRVCSCETCKMYVQSGWAAEFPNLCDWYTHLLRTSPTRTIHIHVLNNTITANSDNVEYMLKTGFHNFPKGKPFSAILGDFLGRGIFNVDGDVWRQQRKLASLELGRTPIKAYLNEVVGEEISRRLIPLMETTQFLDLQEVFRRFSFDSICRFSFGLDPKCLELSLPLSEFAVSFDLASELSAQRAMAAFPIVWKIKRLLNVGSERRLREAIRVVHIIAVDIIRQRRKFGFDDQKDLLSKFMNTIADEAYLRDIVISFLLAGRDTVASALTSFFWLIARHPAVEAALLLEADRVIGPRPDPEYEQLRDLHYLNAAIYESMRLYPPIQFDSKFCLKDDILPDGSFVKSGTRVTYHPYAMGRMEEIWGPDFLEFRPDRWIREGTFIPNQNPFKYPVFQAGTRVCLGKEMALVELKTIAISVLRQFQVELVQPEHSCTPRFSPGLTATFKDGLRVRVRTRTRARAANS